VVVTPSITASSARAAAAFEMSAEVAMWSISSVLFTASPRHKGIYRLYSFNACFKGRKILREKSQAVLNRGGLLCVKGNSGANKKTGAMGRLLFTSN
jgi:hypothetical protein